MIYIHMYVCLCICICMCMYIHTYIYVHVYIYIHIYTHICIHTNRYIHIYMRSHLKRLEVTEEEAKKHLGELLPNEARRGVEEVAVLALDLVEDGVDHIYIHIHSYISIYTCRCINIVISISHSIYEY